MGTTILEARAVISAEDKTAAAFAAIEKRVSHLSQLAGNVGKAIGGIGGAAPKAPSAGSQAASVGRGAAVAAFARGTLGQGMRETSHLITQSTMGLMGGMGAIFAAHNAAAASASRVHERVRMQVSGMSREEIAKAEKDAADIAANFPAVGQTEIMHMLRNARSIVGSYHEAAEIMEPLVKLRMTAQLARPGQDVSEDFDQLVKGLEIKGVTQHHEEFQRYMQGIAKGLNVFGDTLKPYQYYEMFKYGRQATPALSEQFILSTAPTLAQELGGSSYGKAVSAFNSAIVGGVMKHSALKEFVRMGLADRADLDFTKTGEAKGFKPGHHLKGAEIAQMDPNRWIREFLLPALSKVGIKDKDKILREISILFQNQMAGQMVGLLATQQSRIDKDSALVRGAPGLEAADIAARQDPHLAWESMKHAIEGLIGTVGSDLATSMAPIMSDFGRSIANYTKELTRLSDDRVQHPDGTPAYQRKANRYLNYFTSGLDSDKARGEIPLLDRNAADYAAQRKRLLDELDKPNGPGDGQRKANRWLNSLIGDAEYGDRSLGESRSDAASNARNRRDVVLARLAEIDEAHQATMEAQRTLAEAKRNLPSNMSMYRPDLIPDSILGGESFGLNLARGKGGGAFDYSTYDPRTGAPKPQYGPEMPEGMAAQGPAADLRAALAGTPIEANVRPDQITAKLEGEGTVNVTVRVEAGSELIRAVETSRASSSSGNIKLNTGVSMPEASRDGRGPQ